MTKIIVALVLLGIASIALGGLGRLAWFGARYAKGVNRDEAVASFRSSLGRAIPSRICVG